ncbi:hypothetical protein V6N12_030827 [Hibiscus sabdariffa]|uniref:Uncharacterized protein n=1 Tax=Hibiscus sabdariffa TaxID=183260 RepID=A0ABR2EAP1_9ROSI
MPHINLALASFLGSNGIYSLSSIVADGMVPDLVIAYGWIIEVGSSSKCRAWLHDHVGGELQPLTVSTLEVI